MKNRELALHLWITIIFCFLSQSGCKQEKNEKESYAVSKRPSLEAEIISTLINSEDSCIRHEYEYLVREKGPTSQIFIGIFDRFFLAPNHRDSAYLDSAFANKGVSKELIKGYLSNTDTTTRFEARLDVRHKYLYITDTLLNKPNFLWSRLPKKHVSNYCWIKISRPILNADSSQCLMHMQNSCLGGGAVYFLKRKGTDWDVEIRSLVNWNEYPENWI